VTEVHQRPAAIAQRLAADLAEAAGPSLLAVYLHGSAVLGGWIPGRSDVDLLIVAANETDEPTADSMVRVIVSAQPESNSEEWPPPTLETSIVAAGAARYPGPPWPFRRHVVAQPAEPARVVLPGPGQGDRDLLMHYVACRVAGYAAFGPPPRDLIGPVARAEILDYLADEMMWGLANAPERYAVLNACRALVYLHDGAIVSKIAGGEAVLRQRAGPADVITRALAQQRGTGSDQPPTADAIGFVEATATLLRQGA
jgi:streptomycin 3"-adenylyltransferase